MFGSSSRMNKNFWRVAIEIWEKKLESTENSPEIFRNFESIVQNFGKFSKNGYLAESQEKYISKLLQLWSHRFQTKIVNWKNF